MLILIRRQQAAKSIDHLHAAQRVEREAVLSSHPSDPAAHRQARYADRRAEAGGDREVAPRERVPREARLRPRSPCGPRPAADTATDRAEPINEELLPPDRRFTQTRRLSHSWQTLKNF